MDKKYIFIGGGVLLVAGIAYFYIQNKNSATSTSLNTSANSNTSSGGTSSNTASNPNVLSQEQLNAVQANLNSPASTNTTTGIILNTPEQVIQVVNLTNENKEKANVLVSQINGLKARLVNSSNAMTQALNTAQNSGINTQIQDIRGQLAKIGYNEVNGIAIKI